MVPSCMDAVSHAVLCLDITNLACCDAVRGARHPPSSHRSRRRREAPPPRQYTWCPVILAHKPHPAITRPVRDLGQRQGRARHGKPETHKGRALGVTSVAVRLACARQRCGLGGVALGRGLVCARPWGEVLGVRSLGHMLRVVLNAVVACMMCARCHWGGSLSHPSTRMAVTAVRAVAPPGAFAHRPQVPTSHGKPRADDARELSAPQEDRAPAEPSSIAMSCAATRRTKPLGHTAKQNVQDAKPAPRICGHGPVWAAVDGAEG